MPDTTEEARDDVLSLRCRADDRPFVIHTVGELDHITSPRLADELAKAARTHHSSRSCLT